MRTRLLPRCTNREVEEYLQRNDIVFIPIGSVEVHGGMPLECEGVLSSAMAVKLAEKVDGLVLPNLYCLYAGATQSGRGTVSVSVRASTDYLLEICRSLLRQGFKRQIFISMHNPAHLFVSPVIRDFFDANKVPIAFIDAVMLMTTTPEISNLLAAAGPGADPFTDMIVGAYDFCGRLDEIPLTDATNDFSEPGKQPTSFAKYLSSMAYASGAVGFYYIDANEHWPTEKLETPADRQAAANRGQVLLDDLLATINIEKLVQQVSKIADTTKAINAAFPWTC